MCANWIAMTMIVMMPRNVMRFLGPSGCLSLSIVALATSLVIPIMENVIMRVIARVSIMHSMI
ncbi:MAG: hypothetical protein HFI44_16145 [Lachnospiraceae bacterium]|nr:hypothetical protein [Lachnospiraceae bacterium]